MMFRMHNTTSDPLRTVSVIGGRGFLGGRIADRLQETGHRVHILDRDRPAFDATGLLPEVAGSDWVVWAASSINPMIADNDPDRVVLDAEAFEQLLRGLDDLGPIAPRVLLLSSGGTVYDESVDPPYAEDSPVGPSSAYGRAKLALEQRLFRETNHPVVLRVSNAYGPGQRVAPGQGVVAHWLYAAAAGQPLHLFGDPAVARDYVHVADIAEVARLVIETGTTEPVLNVGGGCATSLEELLAAVTAATDLPLVVERHPARSFDARSTWLDCRRTQDVLGWRTTFSLTDGIADTWRWLRSTAELV